MNMISPPAQMTIPIVASRDLFGDTTRLNIEHDGMVYTLQITRQGKLLLTK